MRRIGQRLGLWEGRVSDPFDDNDWLPESRLTRGERLGLAALVCVVVGIVVVVGWWLR